MNYHLHNGTLVLQYDGKVETIKEGDTRFNAIVEAIKNDELDKIPNLVEHDLFSDLAGFEYDKDTDKLTYEGKELPQGLRKKVLGLVDQGMPIDRFVKFVQKLHENPSFRARKMLYAFLEHNGHPLTEDGNFIAYRGCTHDFKDRRTGRFDNSVGSVCKMDRADVDDDPNNTCSHGLHVAAYDYAYNWGAKTLIVEVNPKDVVAVPVDYNGTKMRVCEFKVLEVCQGVLEEEGGYDGQEYDEYQDFDFDYLDTEEGL